MKQYVTSALLALAVSGAFYYGLEQYRVGQAQQLYDAQRSAPARPGLDTSATDAAARSATAWARLREGMSEAEVRTLFGPPDSAVNGTLRYGAGTITLKSGKVASFRR